MFKNIDYNEWHLQYKKLSYSILYLLIHFLILVLMCYYWNPIIINKFLSLSVFTELRIESLIINDIVQLFLTSLKSSVICSLIVVQYTMPFIYMIWFPYFWEKRVLYHYIIYIFNIFFLETIFTFIFYKVVVPKSIFFLYDITKYKKYIQLDYELNLSELISYYSFIYFIGIFFILSFTIFLVFIKSDPLFNSQSRLKLYIVILLIISLFLGYDLISISACWIFSVFLFEYTYFLQLVIKHYEMSC